MYKRQVEDDERADVRLCVQTENEAVIRKVFTLLKKTFNIEADIAFKEISEEYKNHTYTTLLSGRERVDKVLQAVKMYDNEGIRKALESGVSPLLIKNSCCKRAFLRGAFLCTGCLLYTSRCV